MHEHHHGGTYCGLCGCKGYRAEWLRRWREWRAYRRVLADLARLERFAGEWPATDERYGQLRAMARRIAKAAQRDE